MSIIILSYPYLAVYDVIRIGIPVLGLGLNCRFDLHCHTTYSDGVLSPEDLVQRAFDNKVTGLAITDHDNCLAFSAAQVTADLLGVSLIAGIEFSSQWRGRGIHIVGLNIDPQSLVIKEAEQYMSLQREKRAVEISEKLSKLGINGSLEAARKYAPSEQLGRPHFAQFLVEARHAKNIAQAFKRYLGSGKPGDVKQVWPEVAVVVDWITQAGGVAVIAHPLKYKMTRTKLRELCDEFKCHGGGAIEIVSGGHQSNIETRDMADLANRFELLGSSGSDFHAPGAPWQELGVASHIPLGCEPVWNAWR